MSTVHCRETNYSRMCLSKLMDATRLPHSCLPECYVVGPLVLHAELTVVYDRLLVHWVGGELETGRRYREQHQHRGQHLGQQQLEQRRWSGKRWRWRQLDQQQQQLDSSARGTGPDAVFWPGGFRQQIKLPGAATRTVSLRQLWADGGLAQ